MAAAPTAIPAMAPVERPELVAEALLEEEEDDEEPPLLLMIVVEVAPAAPAVPVPLPPPAVFPDPGAPVFVAALFPDPVAVGLLPTEEAPYWGACDDCQQCKDLVC
jgi:hypothetical protein